MEEECQQALDCGAHQSMMAYVLFIWEQFALVVGKAQWVVLTYSVAKELPGLGISPTGVKEERDRRPT